MFIINLYLYYLLFHLTSANIQPILKVNNEALQQTSYTITLSAKPVVSAENKETITVTKTEIKTQTEVQLNNQFYTVTLPPETIILPSVTKVITESKIITILQSAMPAFYTVTVREYITVTMTEIKPVVTTVVQKPPNVVPDNQNIFWAFPGYHPNPLDPNWALSVSFPKPTAY